MDKAIKRYFPIFALPTLLAFTIGFILPFILGVYLSFCEFTTVTDAKFVGLKNYVRIWGTVHLYTRSGTQHCLRLYLCWQLMSLLLQWRCC